MSTLSDKILSYSPEQYIRFNTAYSTSPTNLGNGGQDSWSLSGDAPTLNASGGPDGEGHWEFNPGGNNDTTPTRLQISTTAARVALDNELTDADFSAGIWFKFSTIPTTEVNMSNGVRLPELATKGRTLGMQMMYGNTTDKGKIRLSLPNGSITFTSNRYDDDAWHYAAIRVVSSTSGTMDSVDFYIDGQSIYSFGSIAWSTSSTRTIRLGENSQTATPDILPRYALSNFYIAPSSSINATDIAEIWAAGAGAGGQDGGYTAELMEVSNSVFVEPTIQSDANITQTPATASALMTEPTIAITAGDHTEVTTSIIASAEFLPNFAVYASQNINITITETLNAIAELINNVEIDTGTNNSFPALEFTASAEFMEPFLSRAPMTASAIMGNHQPLIQASYFGLVKPLNPYLYIYDGSATPINSGYQSGTLTVSSGLQKLQTPPVPLSINGEQKAWRSTNNTGTDASILFTAPSNETSFDAVLATQEWSFEQWIATPLFNTKFNIINDSSLFLQFEEQSTGNITRGITLSLKTGTSNTNVFTAIDGGPTNQNTVYHVVVTSTKISSTQQLVRVWLNTAIVFSETYTFTPWTPNKNTFFVINSDGGELYHDEIALYNFPLSSSQIIQHYNFMTDLSPDATFNPQEMTSSAESGNHQFVVTSNVYAIATPITASADFVMPSVLAQKTINISATALTASALNTDVIIYYGWTIYADPMIASAEKAASYFLNSFYADYVQANIAPYRYVSFDDADPYTDFGTDNDYSVVPTVVGGTIVNPDLGLNGKSAKTAGLNYATDGVILKESEWNDSWDTGQNSYHSAFWFQRALDDNSTTGLRVLWNLNGYKDNQHVVLYQYQGKLHMQFNNGSGTWIEQDTGTLDLFDYQRHFVVIEFDHTNVNNNTVRLYVDAVLRSTINLGTYTGQTLNADIADSGPNDEANNHPRLSVGCLITPFAATALPVQPTNTKLIIDEIYWDKNSIDATMVVNLYNAMPDKNNKNIIAELMNASGEFVMPAISTTVNFIAVPATASTEFIDPSLYIERFIVNTAELMEASALMPEPATFVPVLINADVMVASAIFDNPGVVITIPGATMYANAILKSEGIYLKFSGTGFNSEVRYYPNMAMTPWLAYLRATSTEKILPMREVK